MFYHVSPSQCIETSKLTSVLWCCKPRLYCMSKDLDSLVECSHPSLPSVRLNQYSHFCFANRIYVLNSDDGLLYD